jgi:hypothetical protein
LDPGASGFVGWRKDDGGKKRRSTERYCQSIVRLSKTGSFTSQLYWAVPRWRDRRAVPVGIHRAIGLTLAFTQARLFDLALNFAFLLQILQPREFLEINPVLTSRGCGLVGQQCVKSDERNLQPRNVH